MNQFRNERKFIFIESATFLEKYFKSHGASDQYPERQVNSIYFDSYLNEDLINSIEGINLRSKTRLRWYGNIFDTTLNGKIEKKIKRNNQNFKLSYRLDGFKVNKNFNTKDFSSFIDDQLKKNNELYYDIKTKEFNVFVSYKRKYLILKNIRLTIDYNICFINLRKIKLFSQNNLNSINQKRIVEIKYLDDFHKDLTSITKLFKNRLSKFSKYQAGFFESF